MKQMMLVIAMIVASITVKAQVNQKEVPTDISSSFSQKFPGVSKDEVTWDQEGTNYKAEFSKEEQEYEVLFDNKGKWINTEIDNLSMSDLPKNVQDGFSNSEYKSWDVNDVEKTEKQDKSFYKLEVKSGSNQKEIYFDDKGKMMKGKADTKTGKSSS